MHPPELVIRGRRIVTEHGVGPASVHVTRGYISSISIFEDVPEGADLVEAFDSIVMPGLVDTHVHVNEPGRTDWEGFETATRAAAAGGVTTLVDMPLNSIPATTTPEDFEAKLKAATRQAACGHCVLGRRRSGKHERVGTALGSRRCRLQMLSDSFRR